ncbi:MAG: amidohydrolase [Alphaproteobacteria bacterium]|nr:amidohydrolase [Alphaproteobacteria bacterium]
MQQADLIITNARVITMDKANPFAEAIAVVGNKIVAVGTRDDVAGFKAKHTRMMDAQSKSVIPGIIEGHVHLFGGAAELGGLILNTVNSFQSFYDAVSQYRKAHKNLPVLMAHAIAHESLGRDGPITRQLLDRIVSDIPFVVNCFDHHTAWANTKALEAAGIMRGRKLPVGNEIVLDAQGLATGELKEPAAFSLVQALGPTGGREWLGMNTGEGPVPPATAAQRAHDEALLKKGIAYANSLGITTMHNMDGNWYQLELLKSILDSGDLNARMEMPFHQKNYFEISRVDEAAEMHAQFKGDMLWSGRVKIFMDGVMETLTALMLEDYPGHPGNIGAPLFTATQFNAIASRIDKLNLQISVHAIGDGAVRRTLDGFEAAQKANGKRDSRHRIEHIEIIHPTDIPRIKGLGVIASLQPVAGYGVPWMPKEPIRSRLGAKLPLSYPWQTIRNSGATVAFSSDWPVASLDPYLGFQAAMTAEHFGQAQNLMDTIHGFTAAGAIMDFTENRKGMLKLGYFADIAVLDHDLEKTPADQMSTVKPVMTICDGRVVFEK